MRLGLEAGKDTLELAVRHQVLGVPVSAADLVSQGLDATLAPLRDRGLVPCQIGAFAMNALHPEPAVVAAQSALLSRVVELAPATGCTVIVVAGGNYHPSGFGAADRRNYSPRALERVAAEFRPICRLAERAGVVISVEPYIKSAVHSPEAFLELRRLVGSEALKVNLDVTNFYDLRDLIDPTATCRRVARALKGCIGLVHVKDIALREGFHIQAGLAPITEGPTDWALVLELAREVAPADCWVLLEHVQSAREAERSIDHLRRCARTAGVTL